MASQKRTRYIIAYDVTNNSKRAKLANLLLDYGDRMQKSVFEAELTRSEMQEILVKVAKYLEGEDSLRMYPLCQNCRSEIRILGRTQVTVSPGLCIV